MNPSVTIITLNWNGWLDTIECLESLYQIDYPNYNVIVVDNDSKDESIQKIREYCQGELKPKSKFYKFDIKNKPLKLIEYSNKELESLQEDLNSYDKKPILIKNDENYGFAKGNNIGIKFALNFLNSDYVLLLNNDTVVNKNFLNKLVKVAESDAKIGIIGPKIYYYDFDGKTDVATNLGGKINLNKYPGYYDLNELKDFNDHKDIIECDWVSGAAMLMKFKSIPIKYLNNELFFGNENIDLCINLKNQGYRIFSVLDSNIWHKEGVSRKKRSSDVIRKVLLEINTNLKFLKLHKKHYYPFLPVYLLQIIYLYSSIILKKIFKR